MRKLSLVMLGICLLSTAAFAQQTGSVSGTVTLTDGDALPGVVVEAAGDVLPKPRITVTSGTGDYRFPLLPPGYYEITFTLDGMRTEKRSLTVHLQANSDVDIMMAGSNIEEEIVVTAAAPVIDTSSAQIKVAISDEVIEALPVGQEYRDLIKLIPGVQYSEDTTRGPSAGGSGQDNVYQFDGVNVTRPMFGSLSTEPSSHDIEQVAVVRGGAPAKDFNRSGGLTINTLSKSGTNQFRGMASYQVQTDSMTSDLKTSSDLEFDKNKDWAIASIGGPIVPAMLNFYASYYRPTEDRGNVSNLYGEVPDFDSVRDEYFGKLSFTPTDYLLINGSYRDSTREDVGLGVTTEDRAGSTSEGVDVGLNIATLEASWVINANSFLSFKYTDFENTNSSRPDNLFGFPIRVDGSVPLDVGALDTQGLFLVPQPIAGEDAYNAFIDPLINRYGFIENGVPTGGGIVGGASTIDDDDFFRESFELGYDYLFGDTVQHELHIGYQQSLEEEDLSRTSNGWGVISVIGGRDTASDGTPIFYEGRFEQMSILTSNGVAIPPIHSEFEAQSFELNDIIKWGDWTFNVGVLFSNDKLYGQGLKPASGTVSGFELAPGHKYLMKEVDFDEMIQPRVGAVWSWNGQDTLYANYARYYPAASSLPRAASWARNLRRSIRAYFDADGNLIETDDVRSSSGKIFQDGIDPRSIDEFLVGYSAQVTPSWTGRVHARYRKGQDFWRIRITTRGLASSRLRVFRPKTTSRISTRFAPKSEVPPTSSPSSMVPSPNTTSSAPKRSGTEGMPSSGVLTFGAITTVISTRTIRRRQTMPTLSSAPRSSQTARAGNSGTSATEISAGTDGTSSSSTASIPLIGMEASEPTPSTSRVSPGKPGTSRSIDT